MRAVCNSEPSAREAPSPSLKAGYLRRHPRRGYVPKQPELHGAEQLSLSAILLLERQPDEAAFVWSLVHDVMREGFWLWHEDEVGHALQLLIYVRFSLILLDAAFAPRLSLRTLIRRVQDVASGTPLILRVPPEAMPANPDPRIYGVTAVVPKGSGGPTEREIRRWLRRA